jgi:VanZ family protein
VSLRVSRFLRLTLPALLYAGLIFLVSSLSRPPGPPLVHGLDKAVHFTVYAGLGLLAARALAGHGVRPGRAALWALALSALYAASDEVHQAFVPGRSSEVWDWVADVLGAGLAARLWWGLRRRARAPVPEGNP